MNLKPDTKVNLTGKLKPVPVVQTRIRLTIFEARKILAAVLMYLPFRGLEQIQLIIWGEEVIETG